MAAKPKFFSWSKGRHSTTEPYHRTGGLLPIDTSVGEPSAGEHHRRTLSTGDAKKPSKTGRRRPPNLTIVPPEYNKPQHLSAVEPASARHNVALVSSASNLFAVVNDMLRSPALSATACPRSSSIHKPLPTVPGRPRSVSLPSTPDLPAELPGSLLLENQGYPDPPVAGPADRSTMRSVRSGTSLRTSVPPKPTPSKVPQHKTSLSEANLKRRSRSRPSLLSPSSTDSRLTTCSVSSTNGGPSSSAESTKARVGADRLQQPSPLALEGQPWTRNSGESSIRRDELGTQPGTSTPTPTRSKQIDELKSTITAQDNTISTLQAQFASLRASHEAHIASLSDAHRAELASLRNYSRALEEQQSQRTLHHASSNHLLFLLDTTELQSPTRESPQTTAGSNSANSIRSFTSALEQQSRSPHPSRESPEMENLKRKLSTARRPEVGNRDTIRELNQYKQNNAALQKQIESLMAKLNESKKNERNMAQTLEEIEKNVVDWKKASDKAEQLEKSNLALQNTIDHLEHRLDVANCDKLDAHEQLYNLRSQRSPFDSKPPTLPMLPFIEDAHMSMSTVFSSGSPLLPSESQEPTTLSAFIARIERLQEEVKQKDDRNAELQAEIQRLVDNFDRLEKDHKELVLQSEIQSQLLKKTRDNDTHLDRLRTIIMDREATIGEKDKALKMVEKQLEHHTLLLKAEIRKHATVSVFADVKEDPLPDLTTLASKEDIDRWIDRLQQRLKKENSKSAAKEPVGDLQTTINDLRKEIDFYVREIIYYKLDIKGYKSDIKKLKQIATKLGTYGSRASDFDSPTPSLCRSSDTPIRARFPSGTPGLGISNTPSPISTAPASATASASRPVTPPPAVDKAPVSGALMTPNPSPSDNTVSDKKRSVEQKVATHQMIQTPMTPTTPPRKAGINLANEADNIDPGISPRSVARLSPERRRPAPPSPDQEKFGDLATNFPLSTPAAPQRIRTRRSMSDSMIQPYTVSKTTEGPEPKDEQARVVGEQKPVAVRSRGMSTGTMENRTHPAVPLTKGKVTPERPPRPQAGLFESPIDPAHTSAGFRTPPPRKDIMAEAMRNSPNHTTKESDPPQELRHSNSSLTERRLNAAVPIPPPLNLMPATSSAGSSMANLRDKPKPSPEPAPSAPFVIGMGSPYNTALITPTASVSPTHCPITGKFSPSPKVKSPTSRAGLDGTMATSSSPVLTATPSSSKKAVKDVESGPQRSNSSTAGGRSASHSRNASGSSIRSAIGLPVNLMKGKGKSRKDSISSPRPLESPFDIDRSAHLMNGGSFGIGEAI